MFYILLHSNIVNWIKLLVILNNSYLGLTEIGVVSIDFPKFSGKQTVGRLVNGVTVKIVDEIGLGSI